jgi:hypothetical protein
VGVHAAGQVFGIIVHQYEELAAVGQLDALAQVSRGAQIVDLADDPARVAAAFVLLALEAVQFLQHVHRQNDVVFVESFQGEGIMQQDVGVQKKAAARHRGQFNSV